MSSSDLVCVCLHSIEFASHLFSSLLYYIPASLSSWFFYFFQADLLLSSGLVEMHELIATTRFSHILGLPHMPDNGTGIASTKALAHDDRPEEEDQPSKWPEPRLDAEAPQPYVVLAPASRAFSQDLLAFLRNDSDARESFVSRHLIKLPGATDDCSSSAQPALFSPLNSNQKKKKPGANWPPAPPGPSPTDPLASLHPVELNDGAVFGTCANHRLNQVSVRTLSPDVPDSSDGDAGTRTDGHAWDAPPHSNSVTIGVHGAYGPAQGVSPSIQLVNRGVQIVRAPAFPESVFGAQSGSGSGSGLEPEEPVQTSGGVLLLDGPIPYDERWDTPPRAWTVWVFGTLAFLAALIPVRYLVARYWTMGRLGGVATGIAVPDSPSRQALLGAEGEEETEAEAEVGAEEGNGQGTDQAALR